jgi:YD repeat-containing protein
MGFAVAIPTDRRDFEGLFKIGGQALSAPMASGRLGTLTTRSAATGRQRADAAGRSIAAASNATSLRRAHPSAVALGAANYNAFAGINRWWTYEEDAIPGVGKYMANVGTGQNLVVQADDMLVHNKGIDLAFRRTYNSQSYHDVAGNDGAMPSQVGNGWTNTFDAHIAYNSGNSYGQGISVFDVDGTRYDYLPSSTTSTTNFYTPPTGIHDTLWYDGNITFRWTKTNGSVYYFYGPPVPNPTGPYAAYAAIYGRVYQILGRNNNNSLTFTYYWDSDAAYPQGDATSISYLNKVTVVTEGGVTATLLFKTFNSNRLLASLVRPDGTFISYSYDSNGNLLQVDEPSNNLSSTTVCVQAPCLSQQYVYVSQPIQPEPSQPLNTHMLVQVLNPRWVISGGTDGQYTQFKYYSWNGFEEADSHGFINPTVSSSAGVGPIQPSAPTGVTDYRVTRLDPYSGIIGAVPSGETGWTWHDSDLHQTIYFFNTATGAVAERAEWTGSINLIATETWDANNNLTETTDARGNATDYLFDAYGNVVAEAKPLAAQIQSGGVGAMFRPTRLYSYDNTSHFDVVAYCDPNVTHSLNLDWGSIPPVASDSMCPQETGATIQTFVYPSYEPFGELTEIQKPDNYHYKFTYSSSAQGGTLDYGLPTQVIGDSIAADSNRTPVENFTYDSSGNVVQYNNGVGTWHQYYDAENRLTGILDPDSVPIENKQYNPDDTIKLTQTASQYRAGPTVGVAYLYDADKNKTSEEPPVAGPFLTSYDADDRVIQVIKGWYTQNLYDLTQGGTLPLADGPAIQVYGNLFETLVDNATGEAECGASGGVVKSPFLAQKAMAYDAADRVTATYRWNCPPVAKTSTYDANGNLGLLSSVTNEVGQTTTYTYDTNGRQLGVAFGAPAGLPVTPSRNYSYDADDHQTQITSGTLGTEKRSYDVDGNLVQYIEAGGDGLTGPVTIQYQPYFDDKRESMTATSSSLSSPLVYTYHYQTDGLRKSLTTSGAPDGNMSFNWTYTPAGRKLQQTDNTFKVTDSSSYDVDGRTNSLTYSAGSLTSFTYDQRDNLTGYVSPATPSPNTISYDGLDEVVSFASAVACGPFSYRRYQDGVLYSNQNSKTTPCEGESSPLNPATLNAFDSRNGQVYGSSFTGTPSLGAYAFTDGLLFDAAGREKSGTSVITGRQPQAHGGYITTTQSGTFSASYDNEDHVQLRDFSTFANASLYAVSNSSSFVWGLDGHPEQINSQMLHWDGDQPLFSSVAGSPVCTYVERLSQCGYVLDRDQSGALVEIHNSEGSTGVCPSAVFPSIAQYSYQTCFNATSRFATPALNPVYFTGDGLEINAPIWGVSAGNAALIVQGTRTFNPATNQWTTPDAYAGEVNDPQSQRSYMWNNNNPVKYADPSGYCLEDLCIGELTVGAFIISRLAAPILDDINESLGGGSSVASAAAARLATNVVAGKVGEALTNATLESTGATVTTQITLKDAVTGTTARIDSFAASDSGAGLFVETKTGNATLTQNQQILANALSNGTAYAVGKNAAKAGLPIGPDNLLPPADLILFRWSW